MRAKLSLADILAAATELGDQIGLYQLELKEIAQELQIKTPSLYNHITGINGLYEHLAIKALDDLHEHLISSVLGVSGEEAMSALAKAYLQFGTENTTLYQAIENPKLQETEVISEKKAKILKLVQQLLKPYHFSEDQELHIIRIFRSYLHGFVVLNRDGGFNMNFSIIESYEKGLKALITGLNLDES